ncbi:MAG TPA: type II secretion system protein GspL [Gammaproteobacteria bacterium]|nr:type II secretion system protein GspL [Gammaproteobacteria bacterium]
MLHQGMSLKKTLGLTMAENLFLRLGEHQGQINIEWMLLDEVSGIVRFRGEGQLDEITGLVADLDLSGSTYVMLRGEEVLLTSAMIPSKQQRQILQAVPFMVEESLAADIEACHFAIGDKDGYGNTAIAVIDRQRLQYWLDRLQDAGITSSFLTVDTLSVPYGNGCSILIDGERVLVRTDELQGFCIESDLLATSVGLLSDEEKENVTLMVHESAREATELTVAQINAEQENTVAVTDLEYGPFESLCRGFNKKGINLLQGEFKVEVAGNSQRGAWRVAAVLCVCAFGLQIASLLGQGMYLNLKAGELEVESRTLYTEIFPKDRNVRDIKRRWNSHLGQVSGSDRDGFLGLFAGTAKHLPGSDLVLNNVNFNEKQGELVLQLETAENDQELIQFIQTLTKLGMVAEIGTINQGDDSVKGSIKIKSLGGS